MKKVYEIDVKGKIVLLRADFNVPIKEKTVTNTKRIRAALKTINYLIENGAKIWICSHLGKIKSEEDKKKNDLSIVAPVLSSLLNKEVMFCDETRGSKLEESLKNLQNGDVLLMQNTRYEPGEEKNDEELSKYYASLADLYINDAFGTCHRAHVTTFGVPKAMKESNKDVGIGFLVEKEALSLTKCVRGYDLPYLVILGGSKVSDKIKMIEGLLNKADKVLIGGAMAYTFLKSLGYNVGSSLVEDDRLEFAREIYKEANGKIVLPIDHIVVDDINSPSFVKKVDKIEENQIGVDIGPKTIALYKEEIAKAKTIFWNGPMGIFENDKYSNGTRSICELIGKNSDCLSVVGGGDSATAVEKFDLEDSFSHVSTGGGASAEMIENDGHLPGIDIVD